MPARQFDDYIRLMGELLDDHVHYIDPVHEFKSKEAVLNMLKKVVPRAQNEGFSFDLLVDGDTDVIWRWTISIRLRMSWFKFTMHGLVHARVENNKIVYQREYYDPMESAEVIPVFGFLYKQVLRYG